MIEPGSGHPNDLADRQTPVAHDAAEVLALASGSLQDVDARSSVCRACPRLVTWREQVARQKRAAFTADEYWGRPVTGWGPADARIGVVGLAPAAHGGNRTGRIFTGDRSGDWLFAALHRAGLASEPTSVHAGDGQRLMHTRITLPVRCAPPDNSPTPAERDTCAGWLAAEWRLLEPTLRAVVVLGGFGWTALWRAIALARQDAPPPASHQPPASPRPRRPAFGHGVEVELPGGPTLLGCFHVSQQNTFTGRLTAPMLDDVFARAKLIAAVD